MITENLLAGSRPLERQPQRWTKRAKSVSEPKRIVSLSVRILQVAAGDYHSIFLDAIGRVWACGLIKYGRSWE